MANLSQIKRIKMFEFLNTIKEEHKDDDQALKAIYEIESEIAFKKYGLVWEEHEENVDKQMETHVPVFTEVKDKEILGDKNNQSFNFLLEGDNLHSLKLLEKTHKGKIDVIYIDPPYNTGNKDFVYDDNFVEKEDGYRHSKWLSFMEKRLRIAYHLLSNEGIIFISIDDFEQAVLKSLMDDIFSEFNFIITLPRITKKSGKTTGSFSKNHDYVLVYTKRDKDIFKMEEHIDPNFSYEDEWVNERGKYKLNQTLDYDSLQYSKGLDYPLTIEGETFYAGSDKSKWEERQKGNHKRADWAWRWSPQRFEFGYKNGFIVINRRKDGTARIYTKTYLNATIEDTNGEYSIKYKKRTKPLSSIGLTENIYSNDNAKKDLDDFGLKDEFDYSKPVELIKRLLQNHYNKDAIVLDFFAGSGTTAQAVLELNAQDNGNRKFILCTNNQNNICEKITYKRCQDVIKTYSFDKSEREVLLERKILIRNLGNSEIADEIKKIKQDNKDIYKNFSTQIIGGYVYLYGITKFEKSIGLPANLKYYKTAFIPKMEENEDMVLSDDLLSHIKEMVQLENGIDIDNDKHHIILTDEDADEIEKDWEKYENCKALYISKNVLLTTSQNALFSSVEINTIPDYYFEGELREVGEIW